MSNLSRFIASHRLLKTSPRRCLAYLMGTPLPISDAVRDRLVQTILDRRLTMLLSSFNSLGLAFAAIWLTGAHWPLLWLVSDFALLAIRWMIIQKTLHASGAQRETLTGLLLVLGTIWSLMLGLALGLCVASEAPALVALAAVVAASTAGTISSRNAATPRHAMVGSVLVTLPLAAGSVLSPFPGMWLLVVLTPAWLTSLHVMIGQNHFVALRLIEAELQAESRSKTDALTGLSNRMHFDERLGDVGQADSARGYSLLCLDLDGFKQVNDTHGHASGDDLLRAVAGRIVGAVREADAIFRLGGDEFVVMLPRAAPEECDLVAERLIQSVSMPYSLPGDIQVTIGVSIGSACAPGGSGSPEAVLHDADMALYRAKAGGRGIHVHAGTEGLAAELSERR